MTVRLGMIASGQDAKLNQEYLEAQQEVVQYLQLHHDLKHLQGQQLWNYYCVNYTGIKVAFYVRPFMMICK